jgi:D-tyrosyl-tRNA(Tyr) deacylase
MAEKIANLRIFEDEDEKMNLSVLDVNGAVLVISQFTLFGDCRRGRRPSFTAAKEPREADRLYRIFVGEMKRFTPKVCEGVFQAHMYVSLVNDGPVTILLDSEKQF